MLLGGAFGARVVFRFVIDNPCVVCGLVGVLLAAAAPNLAQQSKPL